MEHIEKLFKALCEMDTLAIDGLVYPQESVRTERIKEEQEYEGVRVTLLAKLGTSRIPLQVDIGFGDSLWPLPNWTSFPSLMLLPEPKIRSYTPYTAAAEKFHAICHLGIKTSRMKDFYDLLLILKTQELNEQKFQETVAKTFASRRSNVPTEAPFALTLEFANVPEKSKQWNAFVRKGKLQEPVGSLDETILEIRRLLFPLLTW